MAGDVFDGVSLCCPFFPRSIFDDLLDLIESVSEGSKYLRVLYIVSIYNVGLNTLSLQGLPDPEFYGNLVYKFRKIIGKNDFSYHFKKIVVRYKKIGYNID